MLKHIAIGGSLAFAAVVQPGPFQAYLFSRVTAFGWRRTLPASLAPLLSDGPIAVLALLVLGQRSSATQSALRMAGGILLLYLAKNAFQQWRHHDLDSLARVGRVPRTLYEAALVNVMNPNPYLGWTLVLGPIVVAAWNESPSSGVAVVVAFYATMITMLAFQIFVFGGARLMGPRIQKALQLLSSLILAVLGIYQIVKCFLYFWSDYPAPADGAAVSGRYVKRFKGTQMYVITRKSLFLFFFCVLIGCTTVQPGAGGNWIGFTESGQASYYADKHQNGKTASGEVYKHSLKTAAHKKLPFGSYVKVTNLNNGKSVIVKINDRGPFVKGRIIDLSKSAFSSIGNASSGIINVKIELIR